MKINENLQLVLSLRSDEKGVSIYAYHTPIDRATFESCYRILAATTASLAGKGLAYLSGVARFVATLTLKDEAKKDAIASGLYDENGQPDLSVFNSFINDIKRLTLVLVPTDKGWSHLPIDTAISTGKISKEEWEDVQNDIVFFTCFCSMTKQAEKKSMAVSTASQMNLSTTSLSVMDFLASLQKSTMAETTETKAE